MNIIGYSGLHQSVPFKKASFPDLSWREYRVAQGFDSAAAIVKGSDIIAAAAEERFTREKTTGAFPLQAINYCLTSSGLEAADVDWVAHGFSYEAFSDYFETVDETRKL